MEIIYGQLKKSYTGSKLTRNTATRIAEPHHVNAASAPAAIEN
jgi:hypothetical protein